MENLNKPGTDLRFMDSCINNGKRGIRELTSCESTTATGKEPKGGEKGKVLLLQPSSSSSSNQYSLESEETPEILITGGEGGEEVGDLRCVSHGLVSVIGRRRTMEDAVSVVPGVLVGEFDSYDFFAVYDGHGGAMVANACRDRLHQLVAKEMEGWKADGRNEMDWRKVMATCFLKMDQEVGCSGDTAGSTAVVVMVGREEVVVANCGDSRAVLCRGGVPIPLSCDHKPDRPDERERVEAAGGKVIYWNVCRVLGILATSRSIGDQYLKPYVISEPEVTVNKRTELDNFILIGSDGLWDVVSNEVACEVVRRCFDGEVKLKFSERLSDGSCASEAATMLAELAIARGSKDNISVIVIALKKST